MALPLDTVDAPVASAEAIASPSARIVYPDSDGEPLAETTVHINQIVYLVVALQNHFASDPLVFVGANLFLYYVEGRPDRRVAPDVFVVRGVPAHPRRTCLLWQEEHVPDVLFEITSESSRNVDTGFKRDLYERLGVQEYFLFDPLGEYLRPALQGYRLADGRYTAIEPHARGILASERLGLWLTVREGTLRLYDPARGEWLLTPGEEFASRRAAELRAQEEAAARQAAELRAQEEAAARNAAEARARALEAELARLRAPAEGSQSEP